MPRICAVGLTTYVDPAKNLIPSFSAAKDEVRMPAIASKAPSRKGTLRRSAPGQLSVFETAIGWFGLLGDSTGVSRMVFAHVSPVTVRQALGHAAEQAVDADWAPRLRQKLESYALGRKVQFDEVAILRPRPLTEFQQRVVEIVRAIPRGETLTYGEVAALAGSPGAARAVGTVMSTNPVPIIVPCHRVVGSAGGLGGFSAAGGVRTKQWMLEIESKK